MKAIHPGQIIITNKSNGKIVCTEIIKKNDKKALENMSCWQGYI